MSFHCKRSYQSINLEFFFLHDCTWRYCVEGTNRRKFFTMKTSSLHARPDRRLLAFASSCVPDHFCDFFLSRLYLHIYITVLRIIIITAHRCHLLFSITWAEWDIALLTDAFDCVLSLKGGLLVKKRKPMEKEETREGKRSLARDSRDFDRPNYCNARVILTRVPEISECRIGACFRFNCRSSGVIYMQSTWKLLVWCAGDNVL